MKSSAPLVYTVPDQWCHVSKVAVKSKLPCSTFLVYILANLVIPVYKTAHRTVLASKMTKSPGQGGKTFLKGSSFGFGMNGNERRVVALCFWRKDLFLPPVVQAVKQPPLRPGPRAQLDPQPQLMRSHPPGKFLHPPSLKQVADLKLQSPTFSGKHHSRGFSCNLFVIRLNY